MSQEWRGCLQGESNISWNLPIAEWKSQKVSVYYGPHLVSNKLYNILVTISMQGKFTHTHTHVSSEQSFIWAKWLEIYCLFGRETGHISPSVRIFQHLHSPKIFIARSWIMYLGCALDTCTGLLQKIAVSLIQLDCLMVATLFPSLHLSIVSFAHFTIYLSIISW